MDGEITLEVRGPAQIDKGYNPYLLEVINLKIKISFSLLKERKKKNFTNCLNSIPAKDLFAPRVVIRTWNVI